VNWVGFGVGIHGFGVDAVVAAEVAVMAVVVMVVMVVVVVVTVVEMDFVLGRVAL
jgi:uncharacterized membrane protein